MRTRRKQPVRHRSQQTRKSETRRQGRHGLFFECLEIRRVLDASALLSPAGTVTIEGTEDADRIVGFVRDRELCFEINGAETCFNNSRVRNIQIYGLGGSDHVELKHSVLQPAFLQGGEGSDRLFGGDDIDVLVGGTGEDYFDGGAARDYILAQDGFVDMLHIDELDFVLADDFDVFV